MPAGLHVDASGAIQQDLQTTSSRFVAPFSYFLISTMTLYQTGFLLKLSCTALFFGIVAVNAQGSSPQATHPLAASVPLPERNPLRNSPNEPENPAPPHPSEREATEWFAQDIQADRDQCAMMLDGTGAVYQESDPIREGVCGTPAPIELSSIGTSPAVKISPPARVTCGLAASLDAWSNTVLQPAALNYLSNEITEIRNVASYVCRNRYNAPNQRISEHALANALDMAAFKTNEGEWITVLDHWGMHVERNQETVELPASEPPAPQQPPVTSEQQDQLRLPAPAPADVSPELLSSKDTGEPTPYASFLKELHTGGCKLFGTVLGPEANDAHKDHFHFDLAARNHSNYCE